ncbi:hypothetical protein M0813_17226 [Anaeramoeba flamelloides]|uniref:Uncharacterized protein n=1 Tax=Anaeramoeba flamelloides TaxID=1746091 RepID=A0ABQ8YWD8_9EUKA|nr:hypothetical protein M0813_17226 [Anaeramoeba flamelloides]
MFDYYQDIKKLIKQINYLLIKKKDFTLYVTSQIYQRNYFKRQTLGIEDLIKFWLNVIEFNSHWYQLKSYLALLDNICSITHLYSNHRPIINEFLRDNYGKIKERTRHKELKNLKKKKKIFKFKYFSLAPISMEYYKKKKKFQDLKDWMEYPHLYFEILFLELILRIRVIRKAAELISKAIYRRNITREKIIKKTIKSSLTIISQWIDFSKTLGKNDHSLFLPSLQIMLSIGLMPLKSYSEIKENSWKIPVMFGQICNMRYLPTIINLLENQIQNYKNNKKKNSQQRNQYFDILLSLMKFLFEGKQIGPFSNHKSQLTKICHTRICELIDLNFLKNYTFHSKIIGKNTLFGWIKIDRSIWWDLFSDHKLNSDLQSNIINMDHSSIKVNFNYYNTNTNTNIENIHFDKLDRKNNFNIEKNCEHYNQNLRNYPIKSEFLNRTINKWISYKKEISCQRWIRTKLLTKDTNLISIEAMNLLNDIATSFNKLNDPIDSYYYYWKEKNYQIDDFFKEIAGLWKNEERIYEHTKTVHYTTEKEDYGQKVTTNHYVNVLFKFYLVEPFKVGRIPPFRQLDDVNNLNKCLVEMVGDDFVKIIENIEKLIYNIQFKYSHMCLKEALYLYLNFKERIENVTMTRYLRIIPRTKIYLFYQNRLNRLLKNPQYYITILIYTLLTTKEEHQSILLNLIIFDHYPRTIFQCFRFVIEQYIIRQTDRATLNVLRRFDFGKWLSQAKHYFPRDLVSEDQYPLKKYLDLFFIILTFPKVSKEIYQLISKHLHEFICFKFPKYYKICFEYAFKKHLDYSNSLNLCKIFEHVPIENLNIVQINESLIYAGNLFTNTLNSIFPKNNLYNLFKLTDYGSMMDLFNQLIKAKIEIKSQDNFTNREIFRSIIFLYKPLIETYKIISIYSCDNNCENEKFESAKNPEQGGKSVFRRNPQSEYVINNFVKLFFDLNKKVANIIEELWIYFNQEMIKNREKKIIDFITKILIKYAWNELIVTKQKIKQIYNLISIGWGDLINKILSSINWKVHITLFEHFWNRMVLKLFRYQEINPKYIAFLTETMGEYPWEKLKITKEKIKQFSRQIDSNWSTLVNFILKKINWGENIQLFEYFWNQFVIKLINSDTIKKKKLIQPYLKTMKNYPWEKLMINQQKIKQFSSKINSNWIKLINYILKKINWEENIQLFEEFWNIFIINLFNNNDILNNKKIIKTMKNYPWEKLMINQQKIIQFSSQIQSIWLILINYILAKIDWKENIKLFEYFWDTFIDKLFQNHNLDYINFAEQLNRNNFQNEEVSFQNTIKNLIASMVNYPWEQLIITEERINILFTNSHNIWANLIFGMIVKIKWMDLDDNMINNFWNLFINRIYRIKNIFLIKKFGQILFRVFPWDRLKLTNKIINDFIQITKNGLEDLISNIFLKLEWLIIKNDNQMVEKFFNLIWIILNNEKIVNSKILNFEQLLQFLNQLPQDLQFNFQNYKIWINEFLNKGFPKIIDENTDSLVQFTFRKIPESLLNNKNHLLILFNFLFKFGKINTRLKFQPLYIKLIITIVLNSMYQKENELNFKFNFTDKNIKEIMNRLITLIFPRNKKPIDHNINKIKTQKIKQLGKNINKNGNIEIIDNGTGEMIEIMKESEINTKNPTKDLAFNRPLLLEDSQNTNNTTIQLESVKNLLAIYIPKQQNSKIFTQFLYKYLSKHTEKCLIFLKVLTGIMNQDTIEDVFTLGENILHIYYKYAREKTISIKNIDQYITTDKYQNYYEQIIQKNFKIKKLLMLYLYLRQILFKVDSDQLKIIIVNLKNFFLKLKLKPFLTIKIIILFYLYTKILKRAESFVNDENFFLKNRNDFIFIPKRWTDLFLDNSQKENLEKELKIHDKLLFYTLANYLNLVFAYSSKIKFFEYVDLKEKKQKIAQNSLKKYTSLLKNKNYNKYHVYLQSFLQTFQNIDHKNPYEYLPYLLFISTKYFAPQNIYFLNLFEKVDQIPLEEFDNEQRVIQKQNIFNQNTNK